MSPTDTVLRPRTSSPASLLAIAWDLAWRIAMVAAVMAGVLSLIFFPWASDAPLGEKEQAELRKYYLTAYDKAAKEDSEQDTRYVKIAEADAQKQGVKENVQAFARTYGLANKKVLDIGAGRGYLQDVVPNYTGLDISPSVQRFFHKPIVTAFATLMPFQAGAFDAAWTVWVLEHVPNPEAALMEMRRVVKDGGLLYLAPAWDCPLYLAQGYPVRPYSDLALPGKLVKASILFQIYFSNLAKAPIRLLRYGAWRIGGAQAKFHYRRLTPNYEHYWMEDSDAVNTLDRYETELWFRSRGDECLNCSGALGGWLQQNDPLIVRIHK